MLFFVIATALICGSAVQAEPTVTFFFPGTFNEGACLGTSSWTLWFNYGKPSMNGNLDKEDFSIIRQQAGNNVCPTPSGVQLNSVGSLNGATSFSGSWQTMNNAFWSFTSATAGVDYQIRFCCPNSQFIPTTTTTTTPAPITSTTCGRAQIKSPLSRIFGGAHAVANSWPWQVLYQESKPCGTNQLCFGNCGGTIISPYHVLTAAHCIGTTDPSRITLTAGIHDKRLSEANTRQVRTVQTISIHPGWNSTILRDDIAILRVSQPFTYNQFVQPACLPGPDPQADSDVVIIGWGAEALGGSPYALLKEARMKVVGNCNQFWGGVDLKKQICVASRTTGDSACQGDSGGPILQQHNGQWVVQGVASYVSDCKTHGVLPPNVYVRVSAYLSWIRTFL